LSGAPDSGENQNRFPITVAAGRLRITNIYSIFLFEGVHQIIGCGAGFKKKTIKDDDKQLKRLLHQKIVRDTYVEECTEEKVLTLFRSMDKEVHFFEKTVKAMDLESCIKLQEEMNKSFRKDLDSFMDHIARFIIKDVEYLLNQREKVDNAINVITEQAKLNFLKAYGTDKTINFQGFKDMVDKRIKDIIREKEIEDEVTKRVMENQAKMRD
jgi:hypothetical protein